MSVYLGDSQIDAPSVGANIEVEHFVLYSQVLAFWQVTLALYKSNTQTQLSPGSVSQDLTIFKLYIQHQTTNLKQIYFPFSILED